MSATNTIHSNKQLTAKQVMAIVTQYALENLVEPFVDEIENVHNKQYSTSDVNQLLEDFDNFAYNTLK